MSHNYLRSKECSLHNQWDSPLLVVAVMASLSHSRSECQLSAIKQLENDLINVVQHEIDEVLVQAWSVDIIGKQVRSLAQSSHTGRPRQSREIYRRDQRSTQDRPRNIRHFLTDIEKHTFSQTLGRSSRKEIMQSA